MKAKRHIKTPYQRLAEDFEQYRSKVKYPRTVAMCWFNKEHLAGVRIDDIYERTIAARQLGYDVVLDAKDDGLYFRYVAKRPEG